MRFTDHNFDFRSESDVVTGESTGRSKRCRGQYRGRSQGDARAQAFDVADDEKHLSSGDTWVS